MIRVKDWLGRTSIIPPQAHEGLILIISMLAALLLANSPLAYLYDIFWEEAVYFQFASVYTASFTLKGFVNDGLMTLFFLLIGCELKRECTEGSLSSLKKVSLPLISGIGGMVVPALIYVGVYFVAKSHLAEPPSFQMLHGWAIPTATDTAFALGILGLMGVRPSLLIFLMALAITDDLGAIILIGAFYSENWNIMGMLTMLAVMFMLFVMAKKPVKAVFPYALAGVLLWFATHSANIHTSLAGVMLAAFIPINTNKKEVEQSGGSPLFKIENFCKPLVAFVILPLFALANAGVNLSQVTVDSMMSPITLGISSGLFLGKPIGIMIFAYLAVKLQIAHLPFGATWRHILGVSLFCGIGFTMSLFIGLLAFNNEEYIQSMKVGVLLGSLLSVTVGTIIMQLRKRLHKHKAAEAVP
ncbi:MAG: Na+/H+ antiporter NhaA [Alphaproteobacteria bacterium]|nr:Na+/H+ antiporter NhaA [Alphaproteobacteria bacterium]MCL2504716.1 Na+/H+ antiporter NhaA [Alphaproteobacteria bacterium]